MKVTRKMTAIEAYQTGKMTLPDGYTIDRGTNVLLLRRADGSVVAAFGAASTPPSTAVQLAERDFHSSSGRR